MKPFLLIVLLFSLLMTSGCWDRKEINDIAFISGAAGDLTEDGEFIVSFQIALPGASNKGKGDGKQEKFFVVSASGKNATEILQKLQKKSSRMLFTAHRSVIFIGERLAKYGVKDILDIFSHDPKNRLRTYIMVVKGGEGREILQTQYPFEQIPIEAIKEMEGMGSETAVTLRDFFISASSEGINPVMGVIAKEKLPKESNANKSNKLKLAGTAIFKDFKEVGILDEKQTEGLNWIRSKLKFCRITANLPGGQGDVGVLLTHAKRKITSEVHGDKVKLHIELQGMGSLIENNSVLDIRKREHIKLVQEAFEKTVKEFVMDAVTKIQTQYQTDSFGFGQIVRRNHPKDWKRFKSNWDSKFQEVEVAIDVKITISDSGMAGPQLLLKEEEIIK
ncbi:Ger(x)C family spore germination protein [Paenibacillus sp. GCM10023248]|uniref:Ger(x)C family spore germination protein n=1 Tax=unclassified Paenibacillus TaxID=185978 RepID=UPI00237927E8|nr:Ger(x)C family spore germination protein [Paenibacillus sp. MAHUQ-63]MDD9268481.1 Ger(x)C family spore germination protein [Paenibacillus sp. MAHUQ-63]